MSDMIKKNFQRAWAENQDLKWWNWAFASCLVTHSTEDNKLVRSNTIGQNTYGAKESGIPHS